MYTIFVKKTDFVESYKISKRNQMQRFRKQNARFKKKLD